MTRDARREVIQQVIEGEFAALTGECFRWGSKERKLFERYLAKHPRVYARQIMQGTRTWFAIQRLGKLAPAIVVPKLIVFLSFIEPCA